MNSTTALTLRNDSDGEYERSTKVVSLIATQSCIFSMAVIGNVTTLICILLSHWRQRKISRMALFIVHLSIADLSVALFNVAPNLCFLASHPKPCPFQTSVASCKVVHYISLVPIYGSTYILIMTALDRYIAINHPFRARSLVNKHVHVMSGIAWMISFIFSIPQLFIYQYNEERSKCVTEWHEVERFHKRHEDIYIIWFAIAVWIFPVIILSFCYGSILVAIWRRNQGISGKHSSSDRAKLLKPVQITLAVVLGYICCWSPWMISMLVLQFNPIGDSTGMYTFVCKISMYYINTQLPVWDSNPQPLWHQIA